MPNRRSIRIAGVGLHLESLEARTTPAQFTVTNLLDSGAGSLRDAVAVANSLPGRDQIVFSPGLTGVTSLLTQLEVTDDLDLSGNGTSDTILRPSQFRVRLFAISNNANVAMTSLTLGNGDALGDDGGAVLLTGGSLTMSNCELSGNIAGRGGAIFSSGGSVNLINCWLRNNSAAFGGEDQGGAVCITNHGTLATFNTTFSDNLANLGGAIAFSGAFQADINQTTISNNTAFTFGGGIYATNSGPVSMNNSTVTGNGVGRAFFTETGPTGAGIFASTTTVMVFSSIVAGNVVVQGQGAPDVSGFLSSFDRSLIGSTAEATFGTFEGSLIGPPRLGPLAFNGGTNPTHVPRFGSLAIDRGRVVLQNFGMNDQRGPGFARNYASGPSDIGAVEFGSGVLGIERVAVGTDSGTTTQVLVFNGAGGALATISPYLSAFTGGVRVATGDFTGDGVQEIITAAGPGGGPNVKVFDGVSFREMASLFAFESTFDGGVSLGVADVNADGVPDILAAAGPGGGPRIIAIDGSRLNEQDASGVINQDALLASFFAFVPNFNGGVTISSGDFNGDGRADLAFAAGPGGGPHVRVVDGLLLGSVDSSGVIALNAALIGDPSDFSSFFAFGNPTFTGGVVLTTGDIDGDGLPDLVVGIASGTASVVFVRDAATRQTRASFTAFESTFTGGVRLATVDTDQDGNAESIVVGRGRTGTSQVRFVNGTDPTQVRFDQELFPGFTGGVFVG